MQSQPNKNLQISSLGSRDPNNRALQQNLINWTPLSPSNQDVNTLDYHWDNTPNHPIIQDFQTLFDSPSVKEKFDLPSTQNFLFDMDNTVKGSAGVFRSPKDGLSPFGSDIDGKPLYTYDDIRNSNEFDLGKNNLYNVGTLMQQLGVFQDEQDSDTFAKFTEMSSDPNFMGRIEGLQFQGDTKGAVNTILSEFGHPTLDAIEGSEDAERSYGLAFAAYNYAQNSEKLSPSQKSLALSTMALTGYKFKDGSDLGSKALIKDKDGNPEFTVGNAIALAGQGIDIYSLQKNWDQLDAVQRLTFGKGTVSQLASTGQRLGLLGVPTLGGASVPQTDADLGAAGFTSIPSAGIGAITGNGDALPAGYEVVASGEKPGQVIAVPKGLSYSAATINGSNEIRSLNAADGVRKAGTGAFKVAENWLPTNKQTLNARGTSFASGMGQSGILQDPYLMSAVATTSVYGNTINKNQAADLRHQIEEAAINEYTGGASGQIKAVIDKATGGKGSEIVGKIQDFNDSLNPATKVTDKFVSALFGNPDQKQTPAQQGQPTGVPGGGLLKLAAGGGGIASALGSFGGGAGVLLSTGEVIAAGSAIPAGATAVGSAALPATGVLGALGPVGVAAAVGVIGAGLLMQSGILGGGKSEEQMARDQGRNLFKDITDGNWALPLSDGSVADIGTDGKGGLHEFRFPEKDPNKVGRSLFAYDVDYTNDLDFTANMMTSSLARLVAGGKGTPVDQVAGQMANASLGKVGFGQDMTEENFNYVRDNVRGWFFKKGIQTKEDAYALMNQQFGTGRITEMDQIAMQQGINMVFDENGFDGANVIMAGRWKGLEVAGEIPKAPGPNFNGVPKTPIAKNPTLPPDLQPLPLENVTAEDLASLEAGQGGMDWQFDAGTYGGQENTDAFTRSIIRYQDQFKQQRAA